MVVVGFSATLDCTLKQKQSNENHVKRHINILIMVQFEYHAGWALHTFVSRVGAPFIRARTW